MNSREGVNRKREYYDGLKDIVSEALWDDYKASVATFMDLDSVLPEHKETMRFSTEVMQPFGNALAYIVNNRFIVEDNAFLMDDDTDDPPMTPIEIFNVLDRLIPSTVREFLGVLKIESDRNPQNPSLCFLISLNGAIVPCSPRNISISAMP